MLQHKLRPLGGMQDLGKAGDRVTTGAVLEQTIGYMSRDRS